MIVPEGVLFGSSNAHKALRRILVEDQKLDAVISLPSGVFKPYAGVSTAILVFTKTNSGGTDFVWFYDVDADGWSLDDKRTPLLPEDKLGPVPRVALNADEHAKNNLPDVLARWQARDKDERKNPRTAQSFCVPKADIAAQGYDLSLNRYKEVVHDDVEHRPPKEILADLAKLEAEIQKRNEGIGGDVESEHVGQTSRSSLTSPISIRHSLKFCRADRNDFIRADVLRYLLEMGSITSERARHYAEVAKGLHDRLLTATVARSENHALL